MTKETFMKHLAAARRVGTPIIAIQTPDPSATMVGIIETVTTPILCWDIVRGIYSLNDKGTEVAKKSQGTDFSMITNPTEALLEAQKFPPQSIFFFYNAQLYATTDNPSVIQAIWNLRDSYKQDGRTLILLTPNIKLPAELAQDVLILDEPLPSRRELEAIIKDTYKSAKLEVESDKIAKAIESVTGLSAFTAEQVTAMSLTRSGLDLDSMWERKRQTIEQTPGLSVWKGSETIDDIGGLDNIKFFLKKLMTGNDQPNVILFIDEIEKAMGSQGGVVDGGTSQEMLGTHLTYMEDREVTGVIAIGPPGAGKSLMAKVAASLGGILCVQFNFSAMKDSLVGNSDKNLRAALKVVDAISGGKVLCIATCNSITSLPPELRRRFSFGTFFFDLPSREERATIWPLYIRKYGLDQNILLTAHDHVEITIPVDDTDWTGAEIRNCCNLSYRLNISLKEAAEFIVPVAQSAAEQIEKLRLQAHGRFISASKPGKYIYEKYEQAAAVAVATAMTGGKRKVDLN